MSNKPKFNADAAEEYFTTELQNIRNTAKRIFDRDNVGNGSSNFVYSADYQKLLGMEIAMRNVLEYFSKFDLE